MDKTNLCKTCKYKDCPLVPNWKIKDPDLLIVGEAPGEDEVRSGIPFTGSSGQLMRKILRETGFQMSRIAICNTCKCRPPENATPKEKEIALCAGQFLFQEIEEMRPKAILCVGAIASSAFNKDKRLKDVIGEAREWHGMRMMSTYHPAYLLYYPEAESKFRRDLRQLYNILYPVKHERRFVVVDTLEGLAEVKKWAHGKTLMGSDIETNKTLDPFDVNSKILCISFGDDQVSYSISLDKDNDPVYMSEATKFVKDLLGDPHVTHIFHRCWFDVKFLKSRGIEVKRYTDTRLKSFLLNENRLEHGLKELASEYIGEYEYTLGEKDRHRFGLYNCEDSWNTYKLNQIFDKSMTPGLQNVLDRIILPVIPVLNEMMLTGMEVDISYAKKLVKTTIKDREKAYHELLKEHKIFRGINLNSGPQMQSVIFGALKEASVKKTKTGESLDETVMNHFAYAGKTWARKILEIRGFDKLLSTYIKKIPKMVNVDGRIRTQFDPMGTVTGRLSSSEPNLQNIPRDNRVYRMFVASKDKVFFYFDFSQMELRIGCSIANELKMIDAFKHPVDAEGHKIDLHIRTAMMIKSKKASEITKDDRQLAKGTSFGLLYGQGAEGLKQYLFDKFGIDIPLKEAERIRKIFFDTYTGLPLWYRRVQGDLMTNHQIIYPTGRIRRFPQIAALGKVTGDIFRRGVNAPVQGSAGDTVLFVMAHLHRLIAKRKMPSKFVNQVHDSVLLEMDNSKALIDDTKELVELVIKDVVQNDSMFRWIKVPLECEYKVGQNWGELTE